MHDKNNFLWLKIRGRSMHAIYDKESFLMLKNWGTFIAINRSLLITLVHSVFCFYFCSYRVVL